VAVVDLVGQDSGPLLKKVDNAASSCTGGAGQKQTTTVDTFDYLPKRHSVNIEFDQLTYSVSEGRKKGTRL